MVLLVFKKQKLYLEVNKQINSDYYNFKYSESRINPWDYRLINTIVRVSWRTFALYYMEAINNEGPHYEAIFTPYFNPH